MCGRYYFDLQNAFKDTCLASLLKESGETDFVQKEVNPDSTILTIVQHGNELGVKLMKWGIVNLYGRQINARVEGIEQRSFYRSMYMHRCLIPCHGFYEWKGKQKFYIQNLEKSMFYLAGIYTEQNECLILTQDAYDCIRSIHHRSPIVIEKHNINDFFQKPLPSFCQNQKFLVSKIDDGPKNIRQFSLFDEDLI